MSLKIYCLFLLVSSFLFQKSDTASYHEFKVEATFTQKKFLRWSKIPFSYQYSVMNDEYEKYILIYDTVHTAINYTNKKASFNNSAYFIGLFYCIKQGDLYHYLSHNSPYRVFDLNTFKDTVSVRFYNKTLSNMINTYLGDMVKTMPYKLIEKNIYGKYDEYIFKIVSAYENTDGEYFLISYVKELGFIRSARYKNNKLIGKIEVNHFCYYYKGYKRYPLITGLTDSLPILLIEANKKLHNVN